MARVITKQFQTTKKNIVFFTLGLTSGIRITKFLRYEMARNVPMLVRCVPSIKYPIVSVLDVNFFVTPRIKKYGIVTTPVMTSVSDKYMNSFWENVSFLFVLNNPKINPKLAALKKIQDKPSKIK